MKNDLERPNPDELLAHLQENERMKSRGKLKIFLGYAAGVGKTYTMLETAHQRLREGVEVVVGYIETHGREETDALVEGLTLLPRLRLDYHGVSLSDMDLDAVLCSKAQLVLVDELAHTNIPGMRHPKRYQDVEEILDAGIDVYTTVNIQHLESMKDIVYQITGVVVNETVPDRVIDEAHEIELVDLPTDELISRLQEGKVYVPEQAARALHQFFRKGNLTALREMAMRRAAERINDQMLSYMKTKSISGPWPATDRILVCISSHPLGERLIRTGRRLADDLDAEWVVVFVETPGHLNMPVENQLRIQKNIHMAEELGAKFVQLSSTSAAEAVLTYARQNNITKIIAGKPLRPRWYELIRGSVIDQIIRYSGSIDVYVVSEESANPGAETNQSPNNTFSAHQPFGRYLSSLFIVLLFTLVGFLVNPFLDPANLVMLYLLAVVMSAISLGRGPAIMASFVSVLAFDFFFVDPILTFTVNDSQYILTFLSLLIVGIIIGSSASLLRDQIDILRARARLSQELNAMGRALTAAVSLDQVLETIVNRMNQMFSREIIILLPENETLQMKMATQGVVLSEAERGVAEWAFKNGKEAGSGTITLPASTIHFIPLVTSKGTVGVLGSRRAAAAQKPLTNDERVQMEGVLNLSALAIERASFAEKAAQAEMLRNVEKLQSALLNSISHELRTPLAIVSGVIASLDDSAAGPSATPLDPATRQELILSAVQQTARLNHLVENLLDMTRLEAGAMRLNLELIDVEDLLATVVRQFRSHSDHLITISIPDEIPLIMVDGVLIAQVLANLIDNAHKYSQAGSVIQLSAKMIDSQVEFAVRDSGIGIPAEDLERIFDKFFRVQRQEQIAGTGLGLSICKGIIEAHQGKIWALNNPDRGATVFFTLPITQAG